MVQWNKQHKPGRSSLSALLFVLFLAFVLTSGMVGFLLGRNASRSGGELVDTIVLSPGDSPLRAQSTIHFLSGKLVYREGSPCAGASLQLDGSDRTDVTDQLGRFYFSDVRSGLHTLELLNEDGGVAAGLGLSVDFSADSAVSGDFSGAVPTFCVPENTRMLELTVTLTEDNALAVEETGACFVTKDGQVVDFDGGALSIGDGLQAVTPEGSLTDSVGYVMLPSKEIVLTPQGVQVEVQPGSEAIPGAVAEEDGTVRLGEGVALLPSGEVELPGGETVGGGDKVVLITGDTAEELEELPDVYTPPQPTVPPAQEPSAVPSVEDTASGGSAEDSAGESSAPEDSGESSLEGEISSLPEEPQVEGLRILDSDTMMSWKQQSAIHLFENRTDGSAPPMENGIPVAKPGDSGYYGFRLENPEDFDIVYTIGIRENSFHLPIRYSIVDTYDDTHYLYEEGIVASEMLLVSPELLIPAGTTRDFRIEWTWEYEDWFAPDRDDAYDTSAAASDDRLYRVSLLIDAAQVTKEPSYPEGSTKYPGVHGDVPPIRDRLESQR